MPAIARRFDTVSDRHPNLARFAAKKPDASPEASALRLLARAQFPPRGPGPALLFGLAGTQAGPNGPSHLLDQLAQLREAGIQRTFMLVLGGIDVVERDPAGRAEAGAVRTAEESFGESETQRIVSP